jgi:hypothetical protein
VFDQSLERFPAEVQSIEIGVAALEIRHNAQGLGIVVKSPMAG